VDYFSGFPGCKEHWKRWKWLENFKSWQTSSSTRKFLLWFRWTIFCFLIWQLPATFIHRSVASSKKDEWKIAGEAQWKFIGKGICPGRGRIKYLWGAEQFTIYKYLWAQVGQAVMFAGNGKNPIVGNMERSINTTSNWAWERNVVRTVSANNMILLACREVNSSLLELDIPRNKTIWFFSSKINFLEEKVRLIS
jgi:hypothetical protein